MAASAISPSWIAASFWGWSRSATWSRRDSKRPSTRPRRSRPTSSPADATPESTGGGRAGSLPAMPSEPLPLQGKVALVTGAGRNIGRAIALTLARDGAAVLVNGRADNAFGDVDILVSNAGLRRQTSFLDMSFEEWREILSVALDGAFLLGKAFIPQMVAKGQGGAFVAISGVSTHVGTPNRCHVSASKSGLEGLMRALAVELAPHRITCNALAPGAIETARAASAGPAPPGRTHRPVPLKRLRTAAEIRA